MCWITSGRSQRWLAKPQTKNAISRFGSRPAALTRRTQPRPPLHPMLPPQVSQRPATPTAVATASEVPAAQTAPTVVIAKLDTELNEVDPACFSAADLQCLPCLKLFTAEYPTGLRVDINPEPSP